MYHLNKENGLSSMWRISRRYLQNLSTLVKVVLYIPSVVDVGLQMVRGGLERISNQKNKNNKKKNADILSDEVKVKPTPMQLRLRPVLLESFESKSSSEESSRPLNVVGIAPT